MTDVKEKKIVEYNIYIFIFFAHKKYFHSFITLQLSYWCHMDYFNDVLTTFLGLDRGGSLAVYAGLFHKKYILIYVLRMNEGLIGLEWHEGE